jgi:hypothetical protein
MTNELLVHLIEIGKRTKSWVDEDPQNRWATTPTTDLEYWAKNGIVTVSDYEHYNLVCTVFELTRSAFGYKPSWDGLNSMSDADLKKEADFLSKECQRQVDSERQEELDHEAAVERVMTVHSGFSIGELIGA